MSPFNTFFTAFARPFRARRSEAGSSSPRASRRRYRQRAVAARLGGCEQLESKQLLAVTLLSQIEVDPIGDNAAVTIDLADHFGESAVTGTVVRFETNAPLANPDFFVELFDTAGVTNSSGGAATLTPITATNFLSYVNDDSYDNTFIHRSVENFVVQGGGFKAPTLSADQPGSDPVPVTARAAITNEPGNANQRGTIAMAKLDGFPNSATNQFYFNLDNNTSLNTDNGGFAVFGKVLGSGMSVIDTMSNALTYNATTYYDNGALSDLPLWNVNADNIIDPQDFLTFEDVLVVPETSLMSFTVTSSDTSKLAAAVVNGQLVLTPVAGQTGEVEVTVTGRSALDNSTASGTFVVNLGQPDTLIPIESVGNVSLARGSVSNDIYVKGGTLVYSYTGQPLDADAFAGSYTIERAERVNGVNQLLLRYSDGKPWIWAMTDTWRYVSSPQTPTALDTDAFYNAELTFGIDLNNNGAMGIVVEASGNTVLSRDSSGLLYANGIPVRIGASQITANVYSSFGYSIVAAETAAGDNQLLLKHSTGRAWTWSMDGDWRLESSAAPLVSRGSPAFVAAESSFSLDIDGDGFVGLPPLENVELSGVILRQAVADRKLFVDGNFVRLSSQHIAADVYSGYGWTIVAAETVNGVNQLLLKHANARLWTWTMNGGWSFQTASSVIQLGTTAYFSTETAFQYDGNGDGAIGLPALSPVESTGTILSQDTAGKLYVDGTGVRVGGQHITAAFYSSFGWTIVAAEQVASVNKILLRKGTDAWVWTMDAGWLLQAASPVYRGGTQGSFNAESDFQVDINGDGDVGFPVLEAVESAGWTVLMRDRAGGLYVDNRPLMMSNGNRITQDIYQAYNYTVVSADLVRQNDGTFVPQLLLRNTNKSLYVWTMTTGWVSQAFESPVLPSNTSYRDIEASFGVDGDGDGYAGIPYPLGGDVKVTRDSLNRLFANGTMIYNSSVPLTPTSPAFFNYGYTITAAQTIDDMNQLLFQNTTTKQLWFWSLDASWIWRGVHSGIGTANGSTMFYQAEMDFDLDLNGDGVFGAPVV